MEQNKVDQLVDCLTELALRIERLALPIFDSNGVDDILQLGIEANQLREELSLPRMLELTKTENADLIKFKVWDPRFPDRPGTRGGIAQNQIASEYLKTLSETNLPVVNDYLQRSIRYVKRQLATPPEAKDASERIPEHRTAFHIFEGRSPNADTATATPGDIDAAYLAAGELAVTMLQISLFQHRQITLLLTCPETGDAEKDREIEAREIVHFRKGLAASSDSLRDLQQTLESQHREFLPAFAPLSGLLEFARKDLSELPPVAVAGTSSVDVRASMNELAYSMAHWAKQMQHCFRYGDACNPHHAENVRCIQHAKSCPYDEEQHAKLQQRIADEKSRVMQAYMPFLRFKGMTPSDTRPKPAQSGITSEQPDVTAIPASGGTEEQDGSFDTVTFKKLIDSFTAVRWKHDPGLNGRVSLVRKGRRGHIDDEAKVGLVGTNADTPHGLAYDIVKIVDRKWCAIDNKRIPKKLRDFIEQLPAK